MPNVPPSIFKAVKPFVQCPDPLWECIVQYESGFNSMIVGDGPSVGGFSYGLFQLHVGTGGNSGQGNTALALIHQKTGLSGQAAITYLLQHVDIQAQIGMPPINAAWSRLKNSFNANDTAWWLQFCSISGHPGGSPADPVTVHYVQEFMARLVKSNTFGIQQISSTSTGSSTTTTDNTWLQSLINMPPHQPCSIIWRRTCPGAKSGAAPEGGIDLPAPKGTKVYALGAGTIIGAGYFFHPDGSPGYGVVTVRTTLSDGTAADVYYQHINISPNIILCNQTGGQLYGGVVGPKPSSQQVQTGQQLGVIAVDHTEIGINADWGGVWGSSHPGPWVDDPEDIIRSLMASGGGTNKNQPFSSNPNNPTITKLNEFYVTTHDAVHTLSSNPGLSGPIQVFHDAQQFSPFRVPPDNSPESNWPLLGGIEQGASYPARAFLGLINFMLANAMAFFIRSIFVTFAIIIIIALIINLMSKTKEENGDESGSGGGGMQDIAKVAELAAFA